jgi:hypothetical protein
MSSLKEIEERQMRMYQLIDKMVAEEDLTTMLQIVQQLEQEAKELEAAAVAFQDKMNKTYPPKPKGAFEVVLTPDQRQRVLKATGVNMGSVFIQDITGAINVTMPTTAPEVIEEEAMKQARARKIEEEAWARGDAQVADSLAAIEVQSELHAAEVAKLKQDPRFRAALGLDRKK